MPFADFSQYPYYPALLSGFGEHTGYRNLPSANKDGLLPIFELSHRSNAHNFEGAIGDIRSSSEERLFLLDLCKDPTPSPYVPRDAEGQDDRIARETEAQQSFNTNLMRLLDHSDGFANWRRQVADFPNAIPVIQFSDPVSERLQILRQAALLSETTDSMAIRVSEHVPTSIFDIIAQIIAILRAPSLLLVIFDCGQSRIHTERRSQFAAGGIAHIVNQIELTAQSEIRAVCMSNSFTSPGHEGLRDYQNLDWRVWTGARASFPFLFGDYGAIHRLRRANTFVPPEWRASVVLPLDASWLFYRHPNANDPQGWIDGSVAVLDHEAAASLPDVWGAEIITRAAAEDIANVSSARFWHAAKVNIHLYRQMNFAPTAFEGYEDLT